MARTPASRWNYLRESNLLRGVVKYRIDALRLTQRQAAELCGVTEVEIGKYLRGASPSISNFVLVTLCDKLGIDLELKITLRKTSDDAYVSGNPSNETSQRDRG